MCYSKSKHINNKWWTYRKTGTSFRINGSKLVWIYQGEKDLFARKEDKNTDLSVA